LSDEASRLLGEVRYLCGDDPTSAYRDVRRCHCPFLHAWHARVVDAAALATLQTESFARANAATRDSYPPERRLSGEALIAFLSARLYIVAATTRPDGRPHIAPTGYLVHEERFWLPTTAGAARVRNLRSSPHISLALTEGEGDVHAAILVEGAAEIVNLAEAPGALIEMWRHRSTGDGGWIARWISVRPERLLSYAAPGWATPRT
jgi:nitroimidazol reductase NimA-like FMN-containing flavoprotein (pyridoxamine 5'-phosphate oxidase superfamily)